MMAILAHCNSKCNDGQKRCHCHPHCHVADKAKDVAYDSHLNFGLTALLGVTPQLS